METRTRSVTAEELFALGEDAPYELVKGNLREMTPPGAEHGRIIGALAAPLIFHAKQENLGVVLVGDTGFQLAADPDTVRGPDIAFVRGERIPQSGVPTGYWQGPPCLAVEIVSPSDRYEDIEEKVGDYMAAGTREVWIISPRRRTVTVRRPDAAPVVLTESDVLDAGSVVPGFRIRVAEIFSL
jgi:Uma2 family endonuclease